MGGPRLVRVWSTASAPEGELARARLEAEGIPVLVKGEAGGPYRLGGVDLWVPEELETQARLILESPPPQIPDEELAALAEAAAEQEEADEQEEAEGDEAEGDVRPTDVP